MNIEHITDNSNYDIMINTYEKNITDIKIMFKTFDYYAKFIDNVPRFEADETLYSQEYPKLGNFTSYASKYVDKMFDIKTYTSYFGTYMMYIMFKEPASKDDIIQLMIRIVSFLGLSS
jgi:hypothetical protein